MVVRRPDHDCFNCISPDLKGFLEKLNSNIGASQKKAVLLEILGVVDAETDVSSDLSAFVEFLNDNEDEQLQLYAATVLASIIAKATANSLETVTHAALFASQEKVLYRCSNVAVVRSALQLLIAICPREEKAQNLIRETKCLKILKLMFKQLFRLDIDIAQSISVALASTMSNPANAENQYYSQTVLPLIVTALKEERKHAVLNRSLLVAVALMDKNSLFCDMQQYFNSLKGLPILCQCLNRILSECEKLTDEEEEIQVKDILAVIDHCLTLFKTFIDIEDKKYKVNTDSLKLCLLKLLCLEWLTKFEVHYVKLLRLCLLFNTVDSDFSAAISRDERLFSFLSGCLETTTEDIVRFLITKLLNWCWNKRKGDEEEKECDEVCEDCSKVGLSSKDFSEVLLLLNKRRITPEDNVAKWLQNLDSSFSITKSLMSQYEPVKIASPTESFVSCKSAGSETALCAKRKQNYDECKDFHCESDHDNESSCSACRNCEGCRRERLAEKSAVKFC